MTTETVEMSVSMSMATVNGCVALRSNGGHALGVALHEAFAGLGHRRTSVLFFVAAETEATAATRRGVTWAGAWTETRQSCGLAVAVAAGGLTEASHVDQDGREAHHGTAVVRAQA